ncbi:hypothetical protein TWF481_003056 [Arthrobotrys musiformis]|uniref:Peptidase A1 domain-containing protein n=1 Tax=Arthrobotrys musiformis TaxID=47236 RepID=A0AAV9VQ69_9PEZI
MSWLALEKFFVTQAYILIVFALAGGTSGAALGKQVWPREPVDDRAPSASPNGQVDIPVFRTKSGYWYTNIRAKFLTEDRKPVPQEDPVLRLAISTGDISTWAESYSTLSGNKTEVSWPNEGEWPEESVFSNVGGLWTESYPSISQRYPETRDKRRDLPYASSEQSVLFNFTAHDSPNAPTLYSGYAVRIVQDESGAIDDLDGRWGFAGIGGQGRQGVADDFPEGALKDWGTFATYFTTESNKKPLLQLNVDPEEGDKSKYSPVQGRKGAAGDGGLVWVTCSLDEGYQDYWAVAIHSIAIGDTRYETSVGPGDGSPPLELTKGRLDLPAIAEGSQRPVYHVLDSANTWTRINPVIAYNIYEKIESSIVSGGTYYLPCAITRKEIPDLYFDMTGTNGTAVGVNTYPVVQVPMPQTGFAVQHYPHPEKPEYCAGTIQNAVPGEPGTLGQWFFKSFYVVFKSTPDPDTSLEVEQWRRVGFAPLN